MGGAKWICSLFQKERKGGSNPSGYFFFWNIRKKGKEENQWLLFLYFYLFD